MSQKLSSRISAFLLVALVVVSFGQAFPASAQQGPAVETPSFRKIGPTTLNTASGLVSIQGGVVVVTEASDRSGQWWSDEQGGAFGNFPVHYTEVNSGAVARFNWPEELGNQTCEVWFFNPWTHANGSVEMVAIGQDGRSESRIFDEGGSPGIWIRIPRDGDGDFLNPILEVGANQEPVDGFETQVAVAEVIFECPDLGYDVTPTFTPYPTRRPTRTPTATATSALPTGVPWTPTPTATPTPEPQSVHYVEVVYASGATSAAEAEQKVTKPSLLTKVNIKMVSNPDDCGVLVAPLPTTSSVTSLSATMRPRAYLPLVIGGGGGYMCMIGDFSTPGWRDDDNHIVFPVFLGTEFTLMRTLWPISQIAGMYLFTRIMPVLAPQGPEWTARSMEQKPNGRWHETVPAQLNFFGPPMISPTGGQFLPWELFRDLQRFWILTQSPLLVYASVPNYTQFALAQMQLTTSPLERAPELVVNRPLVDVLPTNGHWVAGNGRVAIAIRFSFIEYDPRYDDFTFPTALDYHMGDFRYLWINTYWALLPAEVRDDLENEIERRTRVWPMQLDGQTATVGALIIGGTLILVTATGGSGAALAFFALVP